MNSVEAIKQISGAAVEMALHGVASLPVPLRARVMLASEYLPKSTVVIARQRSPQRLAAAYEGIWKGKSARECRARADALKVGTGSTRARDIVYDYHSIQAIRTGEIT